MFTKIKNFFHHAADKVSALFTALIGPDAAKKLQDGIIAALKTDVGKVVLAVVTETQTTLANATGPEKHAFALAEIEKRLTELGHDAATISTSTLSTLISGAVATAKEHGFPTDVPADSPHV